MQKPRHLICSLLLSAALGATFAAPLSSRAAAVAGDFEARLESNLIVRLNVMAPALGLPSFSGQIISKGVVNAFKGTFELGLDSAGSYEAYVSVSGIRPIVLRYTAADTSSDSSESLELEFAEGGVGSTQARRAYKPDDGMKVSKSFSMAYKLGSETTQEGVQQQLADIALQVDDLKLELAGDKATAVLEKKVASAAAAVKQRAAKLALFEKGNASYFSAYKTAAAAESTALTAFEKLALTTQTGIRGIFAASKGLLTDVLSFDEAAESIVRGILTDAELRFGGIDTLSDSAAREIATALADAKTNISNLMSSTAAEYSSTKEDPDTGETPWNARIDEYLSELNVDLDPLFPENYTVASARALFVKVGPSIQKMLEAAASYQTKKSALDRLAPEIHAETNPSFDLTAGADLQQELDFAKGELDLATNELASAQSEVDSINAQIAGLLAEKAALNAALNLLAFKGYGVASLAVSASATIPYSATINGIAPDGQKWTSSVKLRADDTGTPSEVLFSTLAGKTNAVEGALRLDLLGDGTGSEETELSWCSLSCSAVGPAPSVVASKTKNVFGLSGTSGTTTVTAIFGENEESGAVTAGFGAQITAANAVKKYLVPKKGTELKIATTPSVSFSGKFTYSGATPLAFSGVFLNTDPNMPEAVEGYGFLLQNAKTSVPVKITVPEDLSGDMPVPEVPEIQQQIAWKGLASNFLTIQLDVPSALNVTTVTLMKGTKAVVSAEANSSGMVALNLLAAVSGSDYTIKVTREYIGGLLEPVPSPQFQIVQKSPPVGSFQCLLSYESLRAVVEEGEEHPLNRSYDFSESPDGNPYRARLSVTTTATGAWTGKLEFINLKQVNDENGDTAPGWSSGDEYVVQGEFQTLMPVLVTYSLKGSLAPSSATPGELGATIPIPATAGMPAHSLTLSIADTELSGVFEKPTVLTARTPTLNAVLTVNSGGENQLTVGGSCLMVTKGVAGAKGKYTTAGISSGTTRDGVGDIYTFDYSAGAATLTYTFKAGATSLTGSASVGRDGRFAVLMAPKLLATDSLTYTGIDESGNDKSFTSTIKSTAYGFLSAGLANLQPEAPKPAFGVQGVSLFYLTGAALEASPSAASGFRYNTGWANVDPSDSGSMPGGLGLSRAILTGVRPLDLSADDRVKPAVEYRLGVSHQDGFQKDYTVKFSTAGGLTVTDPADQTELPLLSVVSLTGLFSGNMKPEGFTTALPVTGTYLRDDYDPTSGIMARGASSNGELTWTLSR